MYLFLAFVCFSTCKMFMSFVDNDLVFAEHTFKQTVVRSPCLWYVYSAFWQAGEAQLSSGLNDRRVVVLFPTKVINVLFSETFRLPLGPAQWSIHWIPGTFFQEVKHPSRGSHQWSNLTPKSEMREDMPPFKIRLHGVLLITHRSRLYTSWRAANYAQK